LRDHHRGQQHTIGKRRQLLLPYFYAVSAGLFLASSSLYWPAYSGLLLLESWNDALAASSASAASGSAERPTSNTAERLLTSVFPNGVSL
jgi:hypothetical protein